MKDTNTNIGYWEQVLKAPTPAYQKLFDAEKDYLLKHIKPDTNVLDIGCGDGRNMRTILEKTKFITGIDNDQVAVRDAEKHFSDIPTVKIIHGEATSLPFKDNSFNVVTFLMILPNLDTHKTEALFEAKRVLKSDGIIILSTFAETAFDEKMKIYKKIKLPIVSIDGTKFIFDKSLGANVSEQFSREEIELLAQGVGLKTTDWQKVGTLAYICTLSK
jgi:ubiquinone/menaquinone biosynthesis C-methylase UbiE